METGINIKLEIEYDGTLFSGWQKQPVLRTVQGELEQALQRILRHPVTLFGSGRTDTGVHAICQTANFHTDNDYNLEKLRAGVNALTGDDVYIHRLRIAPPGFHARFSAVSRTYRYFIGGDRRSSSPFYRRYIWHMEGNLDSRLIEPSLVAMHGEHDFTNFSKNDPSRDNFKAVVYNTTWKKWDLGYIFEIRANRFLPRMVRRIVGQLVAAGRGEISRDATKELLDTPESPPAKVYTAPPTGLFLIDVEYENDRVNRENVSDISDWRFLHEVFY